MPTTLTLEQLAAKVEKMERVLYGTKRPKIRRQRWTKSDAEIIKNHFKVKSKKSHE